MSVAFRNYSHPDDYQRVDSFLLRHYQPGNADGNWIEPIWEYMYFHPGLDQTAYDKMGIWEDEGEIVAFAHYESSPGEGFFQFHPGYRFLRQEMLDYAEANLTGISQKNGKPFLAAFIHEHDEAFLSLVKSRGYERLGRADRPMYQFEIPTPFPPVALPDGFHIRSLADDCDWDKVHRVMWRGFNHPGEPPAGEDEIESRKKMFDTPRARRDLKIAVEAPEGSFVAFCGMFYEDNHRYAYVEPVATDPDFRRMGLGKAAVLEGIRRCAALGATVAYVGSDQAFYRSFGFKKNSNSECWIKYWDNPEK